MQLCTKLAIRGTFVLLAKQPHRGDERIVPRDEDGRPLWSGRRR